MITSTNQRASCPQCKQPLPPMCTFKLFGRAGADVYACNECGKLVLSWQLFIIPRLGSGDDSIVIPTSHMVHRDFICLARMRELEGSTIFCEEKLFVLTDDEFMAYKDRKRNKGATDFALVRGAYCEQVGISPAPN